MRAVWSPWLLAIVTSLLVARTNAGRNFNISYVYLDTPCINLKYIIQIEYCVIKGVMLPIVQTTYKISHSPVRSNFSLCESDMAG